jgi:methylmalonyl-CoA mutase
MNNSDLFNDFPETSARAWKQKIQVDLKGADYNENLVWESPEGIKVKPFYHSEDLETLNLTGLQKNTTWEIGQSIYAGNTTAANKKALKAIENGA